MKYKVGDKCIVKPECKRSNMQSYKKYIISKGGEECGILFSDIRQYLLTPDQYIQFLKYMRGQTVGILSTDSDDTICYVVDFVGFIQGLPNND